MYFSFLIFCGAGEPTKRLTAHHRYSPTVVVIFWMTSPASSSTTTQAAEPMCSSSITARLALPPSTGLMLTTRLLDGTAGLVRRSTLRLDAREDTSTTHRNPFQVTEVMAAPLFEASAPFTKKSITGTRLSCRLSPP